MQEKGFLKEVKFELIYVKLREVHQAKEEKGTPGDENNVDKCPVTKKSKSL